MRTAASSRTSPLRARPSRPSRSGSNQPDVAEAGYTLPAGYAMFNGTSMASPQAAGAAALLLSAGQADGHGRSPRPQLRGRSTPRRTSIKGVPAAGQGNGQFDVNGAWGLLRARRPGRATTPSDAPVCTPISDFLATPDRGTGIYNRCAADAGGHKAGQRKTYKVKITRTVGPDRRRRARAELGRQRRHVHVAATVSAAAEQAGRRSRSRPSPTAGAAPRDPARSTTRRTRRRPLRGAWHAVVASERPARPGVLD